MVTVGNAKSIGAFANNRKYAADYSRRQIIPYLHGETCSIMNFNRSSSGSI